MPPIPDRGSVWIVDLGMAAKVRPCLILSVPTDPVDRALFTYVPHTTALYGTRFEVPVSPRFLSKPGAFDAQQIGTVPHAKLVRRLGALDSAGLTSVEAAVRMWLGL